MLKLQCQHWRDFTQSHLLSELKNQELVDILPNSGMLKWKWHGQEIKIMEHGEALVRHIAKTILNERSKN